MSERQPVTPSQQKVPAGFDEVLAIELEYIHSRRKQFGKSTAECQEHTDVLRTAQDSELIGLSFSGGGIRSATFNLGVLQAMAAFDIHRPQDRATDSRNINANEVTHLRSYAASNSETTDTPPAAGQGDTGLLPAIDYMSTVSGGGYIGSWLSSWILECSQDSEGPQGETPLPGDGLLSVERELAQSITRDRETPETPTEPDEINHLRQHSNYLAPRLSLFSADSWTLVSIYTRGLVLNLLLLALSAIAVILAALFWIRICHDYYSMTLNGSNWVWSTRIIYGSAMTAALCGFYYCLWNVGRAPRFPRGDGEGAMTVDGIRVMRNLVLLSVLAANLITLVLVDLRDAGLLILLSALLRGLPGVMVLLPSLQTETPEPRPRLSQRIWSALCVGGVGCLSGAAGGALLWWLIVRLLLTRIEHASPSQFDQMVVFGPPLVLLAFILGIAVEVGFAGRSSTTHEREWWARLAAWLMICSLVWIAVFGIAMYASAAVDWMGFKARIFLGGGTAALSGLAAWLGSRSTSKDDGDSMATKILIRTAPALFVVATAIGLSAVIREMVLTETPRPPMTWSIQDSLLQSRRHEFTQTYKLHESMDLTDGPRVDLLEHTEVVSSDRDSYPRVFHQGVSRTRAALWNTPISSFLLAGGCAFLFAVALGNRFDINLLSINRLYANRLIRCYLGASHASRKPHPCTGFDDDDDFHLSMLGSVETHQATADLITRPRLLDYVFAVLHGTPLTRFSKRRRFAKNHQGPLHLLGIALNVCRGEDLGRQERQAESMVLSPVACGYTLAGESVSDDSAEFQRSGSGSYVWTKDYSEQLSLGSAVSISGAAASPNMGYHTMPSLAALMTIFNLRLGWWLPNPACQSPTLWKTDGPRVGLRYLMKELFSRTTADSNYIYTSDGGHFENLGIYELIRRRTRFIIAVDAGADPDYEFYDLASLIRKCRIDFGVDIEVSGHAIQPASLHDGTSEDASALHERISEVNFAYGLVRYPQVGDTPAEEGLLIYIKPSLIAKDAWHETDLRQYATANPAFPHEPTLDQFFSESQFEAYRRLGQLVMTRTLHDLFFSSVKSSRYDQEGVSLPDETEWMQTADEEKCATQSVFALSPALLDSSLAQQLTPQAQLWQLERKAPVQASALSTGNFGDEMKQSLKSTVEESHQDVRSAVQKGRRSRIRLIEEFRECCRSYRRPESLPPAPNA